MSEGRGLLLADIVAASRTVAATRSRKAKVAALADALASAAPEEIGTVASYLAGSLRQRRTGLGWRGVSDLPPPAESPRLEVLEVHELFDRIAAMAGSGSQAARKAAVAELFGRATEDEQAWLRGIVTGAVRQGALDALLQEAVAAAAGVPLTVVRRSAMLAGSTPEVAVAALTGGEEALAGFGLEVGRPVLPMLASSAPDLAAAMAKAGGGEIAVDVKLDGIRIQVHRTGRRRSGSSRDPSTTSPPGFPRWSRSPGRCRPRRSCSTGRRSHSTRTVDRGPSRRPPPGPPWAAASR